MKRRAHAGFTLLEVMIVGVLSGIGILGMTQLVIGMTTLSRRTNYVGDAQDQAQLMLKEVTGAVRRASLGLRSGAYYMNSGSGVNSTSGDYRFGAVFSELQPCTAPATPATTIDKMYILDAKPVTPELVLTANVASSKGTSLGVTGVTGAGGNLGAGNPVNTTDLNGSLILLSDFKRATLLNITSFSATTLTTAETGASAELFPQDTPGYLKGSMIFKAQMIYVHIAADANGVNWLYMDYVDPRTKGAAPITSRRMFPNIENFQVRYFLDPLQTDDPTQFTTSDYLCSNDLANIASLKQVRISIVTKSAKPLTYLLNMHTGDPSPTAEDFTGVANTDGNLRRWVQGSSTVRNMVGNLQ